MAGFDPSTCVAKLFSTWLRIKILMGFLMVKIIMLIGITGYLMQSDGGDFANYSYAGVNGTTITLVNGDWSKVICNQSPYIYLRPFEFSSGGDKLSYCPFPDANSNFRLIICVFSLVTILILFFKTPLSFFARQVWIVYALLYFAAFVIDIDAVATGYSSCINGFDNTDLNIEIANAGLTLKCDQAMYPGLTVLDLIIVIKFFLLYTAWGLANDQYVVKNPEHFQQQNKTILTMSGPPPVAAAAVSAPPPASYFSSFSPSSIPTPPTAPIAAASAAGGAFKGKTILQMQAEAAMNPLHR